jgi:hypothetical protein
MRNLQPVSRDNDALTLRLFPQAAHLPAGTSRTAHTAAPRAIDLHDVLSTNQRSPGECLAKRAASASDGVSGAPTGIR